MKPAEAIKLLQLLPPGTQVEVKVLDGTISPTRPLPSLPSHPKAFDWDDPPVRMEQSDYDQYVSTPRRY